MTQNVDRSIGNMGNRFGAFAQLADDAAKRAQRSFEASFSQVQRASLLRDEINAEADTEKTKVANRLKAGEINVAQALRLDAINEAARQQRLRPS